jgi:hypothetical protein
MQGPRKAFGGWKERWQAMLFTSWDMKKDRETARGCVVTASKHRSMDRSYIAFDLMGGQFWE